MQILKQLHGLEIAEYIALIATLISLLVGIFTELWLFPLLFLSITVVLNILNRLRFQMIQRKRMAAMGKKLQQQLHSEIQSLTPNYTPPPPIVAAASPNDLDDVILATVTESLSSIEQSVKTIIQYLNAHTLPERMEKLENLCQTLQAEIVELKGQDLKVAPQNSVPNYEIPIISVKIADDLVVASPQWHYCRCLTQHSEAVSGLRIHPLEPYLISSSWDQTVKIWEIETGNLKNSHNVHAQGVLALALYQNESDFILATGGFDQTIKQWLLSASGELDLKSTLTAHTGSIHGLALLGDRLVSVSYDQTVKQWEKATGELICSSFDPSGAIYAVAVHSQENLIISGGGDGKISFWRGETGEFCGSLSGNLSSVGAIALSPDGQTVAAGCVDGSIKLWQIDHEKLTSEAKIKPIRCLNAHQGHVKALMFSPDGQFLYSGGADGNLRLWHSRQDKAVKTLTIEDNSTPRLDGILSLALSFDGMYLIAGTTQGTIHVWQK